MKSFSVENIKAFEKHTKIDIKPITLFVGKNSCGKSSLIRFPVVLSQTFTADTTSPLKFYGQLIDYGNYEDVVFKNRDESISFSISQQINLNIDRYSRYMVSAKSEEKNLCEVEVSVSLRKIGKKVIIEKNELVIDGKLCYGLYRNPNGEVRIKIYHVYDRNSMELSSEEYEITIKETNETRFFVTIQPEDRLKAILSKYFADCKFDINKQFDCEDHLSYMDLLTMSSSMRKYFIKRNKIKIEDADTFTKIQNIEAVFDYYSNLLGFFYDVCEEEMSLVSYIGPFRMNPQRTYRDEEFQTRRVGVKGENVGTVLIRDYQKKRQLIDKISNWLYKTMGYKLVVDDINYGYYRILLEDDNGIKSNIIDVGYGISQILPVIAQVMVAPQIPQYALSHISDSLVIVEQPELHLHPAAQSELAELFVDGVVDGHKKFLIETHSEHFIRKLQVLIADPSCKLTNEDVAVYYVDKDEAGCAFVKELKINPNGKFAEKWPTGFFDKAHELSMELLRNSIN